MSGSDEQYRSVNNHTADYSSTLLPAAVAAPRSEPAAATGSSTGARKARRVRGTAAAVTPRYDASKPVTDSLKLPDPLPAVSSSSSPPTSTSSSRMLCFPLRRSPMVNALHLSCSFCLIFLAFSVAQNSQTSLDPKVGAIGLGILYTVFTLSNTFSAFAVGLLSVRLSLFFGALTYALYVAANIYTIPALLYASSAVIGLGAAILWTAEGGFIAACAGQHEEENGLAAHSTMGQFNGIFFSIFQVNQFVGNLLAALLYTYHASQSAVFGVMTVICGCGVATLLLLPKAHQAHTEQTAEQAAIVRASGRDGRADGYDEDGVAAEVDADAYGTPAATARQSVSVSAVLSSLRLLGDARLALMVMLIIYSGFSQSWMYGAFPPLVLGNEHRFFILAFMGGMDAFFSYTLGKLSDRIGRLPILAIGFVAHAAVYVYVASPYSAELVVNDDGSKGPLGAVYLPVELPYLFLVALLLAIGDACWNTQIYAILGSYFPRQAEMAFASRQLNTPHSHTQTLALTLPQLQHSALSESKLCCWLPLTAHPSSLVSRLSVCGRPEAVPVSVHGRVLLLLVLHLRVRHPQPRRHSSRLPLRRSGTGCAVQPRLSLLGPRCRSEHAGAVSRGGGRSGGRGRG